MGSNQTEIIEAAQWGFAQQEAEIAAVKAQQVRRVEEAPLPDRGLEETGVAAESEGEAAVPPEDAVEGESLSHLLGCIEMAKMGRIKSPSEKAQAQGGHASDGPLRAGSLPCFPGAPFGPDFLGRIGVREVPQQTLSNLFGFHVPFQGKV